MAEELNSGKIILAVLSGGIGMALVTLVLGFFQGKRQAHVDIYGEYRQWALDYKNEAKESRERVDALEKRIVTLESEKNALAVQLVQAQQELIKERNENGIVKADLAKLTTECNALKAKFDALEKSSRRRRV